MNKSNIILIAIILVSFYGCEMIYSIKGSGDRVTESREIEDNFKGVKVTNHGNLFIEIGEAVKLSVEGDDNLVPHIITKVKDGELIIKSDKELRRGYRSRKGIKYFLTVKKDQLNYLAATSHGNIKIPELMGEKVEVILSSHGDIKIGELKAKDIKFYLTSHGDLKIDTITGETISSKQTSHSTVKIKSGKIIEQIIILTSHGDYLAKNVESSTCNVLITSHGKVVINSAELLEAKVTSHGQLYYKGKPKLNINKGKHSTVKSLD